ncbi:hypothetical protein PU634_04915 [Oceanimonas pelagia]|uniref:Uncharacterized protein n=1 Tax=Oceanimonas pelagia TaxID=3028314 RepID=A0AA50QB52_9GAMM|nr:hypothetical protein [Oceanimonas pelagia]WMC11708.1 hypothetical protein PU634_04915 [Oceanimonas pelagia]
MKLEVSSVTKLRLTELEKLDPVTVILEDMGPGRGKIIIESFGQSWASFWPAMGSRNIAQFFVSCDEHYLAGNLAGSIRDEVNDEDAVELACKQAILRVRRQRPEDLSAEDARLLWDDSIGLEDLAHRHFLISYERDLCELLFECSFYEWDIPQKPNPYYERLCLLIRTVQDGLRQYLKGQEDAA